MTEKIDLGKLRFTFTGNWDASTTYEINDVVRYGASSYVYAYGIPMAGKVPGTDIVWAPLAGGVQYLGLWQANTLYLSGDIVTFGLSSYVALKAVSSATTPSADPANWQLAMAGSDQSVAKSGDTMTGPLNVNAPLTVSGGMTLAGGLNLSGMSVENVNLVGAAPLAIQPIDLMVAGVHMFQVAAVRNFSFNLRGDAGNTLASKLAVGKATTAAILVANGATPYILSNVLVDGAFATVIWTNGQAPAAGNANATDSYTLSVIRTAAAAYTVLVNRTKYA